MPYIEDVPLYRLTTAGLEEYYQLLATKPAVKMAGRDKEGKTISLSVIEKVHALMRSAKRRSPRMPHICTPAKNWPDA